MPDRSGSIETRADFSGIRYAQCWEDADILSAALAIGPGDRVLSIASAGDNALALLADDPAEVVAIDLSAAQLHCLELRIAAFRSLQHAEVLELIGSRSSTRRAALFAQCRTALSADARAFWDGRPEAVEAGIGSAGKFERYFARFRQIVLPLTQSKQRVSHLLAGGGTAEERRAWYDRHWENARWNLIFRIAASRRVLGSAGRDPRFFDHVDGRVADRLMRRIRDAVTATDPAENPYLHWILRGTHGEALPRYLRPEFFDVIRGRLDRLTLRHGSLEDALDPEDGRYSAFNLSDMFEYVDPAYAEALFVRLAQASRPHARLAYWNLLAERRPTGSAERLFEPLADLSAELHAQDKAPFYSAFRVESVL